MTKDLFREQATSTAQFAAPLAAGTYLVGDPCYAFSNDLDDNWQNWLADAWKDVDPNRVRILDGRVSGMRVAASGTAYGDGTYLDQDGFEYPVDAGLLGAVHIGFLRNLYPEHHGKAHDELEAELGMRVVEFEHPFHVSFDEESGIVSVGHISIMTGDDGEDEDYCGYCGGYDAGECLEADEDDEEEE